MSLKSVGLRGCFTSSWSRHLKNVSWIRSTYGARRGVFKDAKDACQYNFKTGFCHLWKMMVIGKHSWWLKKDKHLSSRMARRKIQAILSWLVSLNSVTGKTGQHILLETISKHVKDKEVTGRSQQRFTWPTWLLSTKKTTAWFANRKAFGVVLIDCSIGFIKDFDTIPTVYL